eukprot:TRINITY_DN208_c0_g2_i7.p2 TRINITY_DN208_c0_g2~~TRINITY_DN208_c0_g2_i7.p2  ORF type:complete len:282 (+),score=-4.16 TRINITY_DN208_c0_g2_i7:72-917(+)
MLWQLCSSLFFFFLMIRRPPRSTQGVSSAASDVYKRQLYNHSFPLQHQKINSISNTSSSHKQQTMIKKIKKIEYSSSVLQIFNRLSMYSASINQMLKINKLKKTVKLDKLIVKLSVDNKYTPLPHAPTNELNTTKQPDMAKNKNSPTYKIAIIKPKKKKQLNLPEIRMYLKPLIQLYKNVVALFICTKLVHNICLNAKPRCCAVPQALRGLPKQGTIHMRIKQIGVHIKLTSQQNNTRQPQKDFTLKICMTKNSLAKKPVVYGRPAKNRHTMHIPVLIMGN